MWRCRLPAASIYPVWQRQRKTVSWQYFRDRWRYEEKTSAKCFAWPKAYKISPHSRQRISHLLFVIFQVAVLGFSWRTYAGHLWLAIWYQFECSTNWRLLRFGEHNVPFLRESHFDCVFPANKSKEECAIRMHLCASELRSGFLYVTLQKHYHILILDGTQHLLSFIETAIAKFEVIC